MHALTPAQRRWRRARRSVLGTLGVVIIIVATLIAAAGIAFPWLLAHPEKVRDFLSERLKRPVTFGKLAGDWTWRGPVFTLDDVEVGGAPGGRAFAIDSAELAIDFYAWTRPGRRFSEFRVVGIEVDATRGGDGVWRIARLGRGSVDGGGESRARELLNLASISLRSARVHLTDDVRGMDLDIARVDIDLVNDGGDHRVGAIAWITPDSPPMRIACEGAEINALRCYAGGRDVEVARWLAGVPAFGIDVVRGRADIDVWFSLADRLTEVRAELRADDLVLRGSETIALADDIAVEPRAPLPLQQVALRWQREGTGWRADWLGWDDAAAEPTTRAHVHRLEDGRTEIVADRVDLGPNAVLLSLSSALSPAQRRFLFETSLRGRLSRVALTLDAERNLTGSARLDDIAWRPGKKTPGVEKLAGELTADGGAYVFVPDADMPLVFDFPHAFRQPIVTTLARGTIGVLREPTGWRAELVDFALAADAFAASGRVALVFDGQGKPFMDADVDVERGLVAGAGLFWPINTMPPKTIAWLDRALVAGDITHGVALVHGDLDDWPFKAGNTGRFEARAHIEKLQLDYHPEWPVGHIDAVDATFIGGGMSVAAQGGTVGGVALAKADAEIPSFREAELKLHAEGDGSGPALLAFIRSSALQKKIGSWLEGLSIGGTGDVVVDVDLPLHGHDLPTKVDGSVLLHDADLADTRWELAFGNANGRVRFSEAGFAADDLAVTANDDAATLSMAVGDFVATPTHLLEAGLRGELSMRTVTRDLALLRPLAQRMPGRADWNIELAVDRIAPTTPGGEASGGPQRITMQSDLAGIALDLPAPLRKDADSTLPIAVALQLPIGGTAVDVELGELMRLRATVPDDDTPFAAAVAFNGVDLPTAPANGVIVRGDVTALDVGGWLALKGSDDGAAAAPTLDIDMRAVDLALYSRHFADTHIDLAADARELRIGIDGREVRGTVVMPRAEGRADVTAEFERLHLPEAGGDAAAGTFDPSRIPALHFWAKDMRFGKAQLGEARIETFPIPNGLRFDRLETNSPDIQIRASGDWTLVDGQETSAFDVTFTAQSLGRMLDALGFAGIVEGGQTMARLDGRWQGSPAQFGLARIVGNLEADVGKGRILDVNPGAGRLLGLISLQAIPRRLALDFSDFFKSGMSFDSIAGKFELRDGDAFTTDLQVKGPAADIKITGRTGVRDRDYDQQLEVTPRVGGVLPVVGALTAGPVGAAAGLVMQGMLKRPVDQMVRARYKVTGSWDDPDITLISKERGRAARRDGDADRGDDSAG